MSHANKNHPLETVVSVKVPPTFSYVSLLVLIASLQFAPIVGLLGFRAFGGSEWAYIGLVRDLLVLVLALGVAVQSLSNYKKARWKDSTAWAILLILLITLLGVQAVLASVPVDIVALNSRRLLMLPLVFVAVISAKLNHSQIQKLLKFIFATSVLVAAFGVTEYILPSTFWVEKMRIVEFFSSNHLDPYGMLPFESSGRFFTWDIQGFVGGPVRRAISTYLEPTTLAAGLMCGLAVALVIQDSRRSVFRSKTLFIAACGFLTFSKAFGLFILVLIIYMATKIPSPRYIPLVAVFGIVMSLYARVLGLSSGMFEHVGGLSTAVISIFEGAYFGGGIGNAGNYAVDGADLSVGSESGLGNMLAQVGLIAIVYIKWVQAVGVDMLRRTVLHNYYKGHIFISLLLGWFVSFLYSASSLGVGGNALIFVVFGLYLHRSYFDLSPRR